MASLYSSSKKKKQEVPRFVDTSRDTYPVEGVPTVTEQKQLTRREFQPLPPPQVQQPQVQQPVVGSLSGAGNTPTVPNISRVPAPQLRTEQETGWKKVLKAIGEASQTEWYKMLGDFLVAAGQASALGGFGEALQKGAMGVSQGISERAKQNKTVDLFKKQGFSQEEAEGLAANPELVKDILSMRLKERELAEKGKVLDIDYAKGTINTVDERGVPLQIPIQGSKGYEVLVSDRHKVDSAESHYSQMNTNMLNLIENMVRVIKSSPNFSTGNLGTPVAKMISGTAAATLASYQLGLEANIAAEQMQKMKDMSPTGSHGYGQLTEKEYKGLASMRGVLNQDLKAGEYLQQLEKIKKGWEEFYRKQIALNNTLRAHLSRRIQLSDNYTRAGGIGSAQAQQVQQGSPQVISQNGIEYLQSPSGQIPIVDSEEQAQILPIGSQYINRRTGAVHIRG